MRWSASGASLSHCALLALVVAVYLLANLHWFPEEDSGTWVHAPAFVVSGDEPHYLVMIHSLLADGDLNVGDQYRRAAAGGPEAGRRFRGLWLDHHTFIVDPRSERSELWQRIYDHEKPRRCFDVDCVPYEQMKDSPVIGAPGSYERSAHAVGYPVIAAAFAAIYRPTPEAVEPIVARFSVFVSLLTLVATYLAARSIGLSDWAAVAAVALLALASPWIVYTKSLYAEPLLGLCMATAAWGLATRRVVVAALSISLALVVKPPFVLVGAAWFFCFIQRGERRHALWLAAIVGVSAVGTVLFNLVTTHQLLLPGALGWRWADGLSSLWATFFSDRYGLLVFTPWVGIAAVVAVLRGLRGWGTDGRVDRGIDSYPSYPLMLALFLYLLVVAMQAGTGESCYGPRYWIPFMPWFALLTVAQAVEARYRWEKLWLHPVALGTAALVIPATLQYFRVWNQPPQTGLLGLWHRLM